MECLQASRHFHQDDEGKLIKKIGESKCLKLIIITLPQNTHKIKNCEET